MDRCPIAARSLERPYHIDGDQFEQQYKEHLSGYLEWSEREHAERWLVFPENIGARLSVDETSLSNGELYTDGSLTSRTMFSRWKRIRLMTTN